MPRAWVGTIILLCLFFIPQSATNAQTVSESRQVEAVILSIEQDRLLDGKRQVIFEARTDDGERVRVDTSERYTEGPGYRLRPGTRVVLQFSTSEDGTSSVFLTDVVRTRALFFILVLFVLCTVLVGWIRGALSVVGLALTVAILFLGVFPAILAGLPALPVTLLGGMVILAVNMHLSHGFNRRTFVAFGSTVAGLLLSLLAAEVFVWLANLSGVASDEAALLFFQAKHPIHPTGILLSAIILGAAGVLDDIAITQGETVAELHHVNQKLSVRELFTRAMRVGRHHIASTVNTLVLAYVGASMPLFLLFLNNVNLTIWQFINTEGIAEEIVRTLAGTTALILTVPIATWFAALAIHRTPKKPA